MNKIHTINLGGHPYTVDEDALEYLQAYVRSLKKHFKNSAGCEEIISDIESRLAELLGERMEGKQIVTLREVKEVISIMGSPEEFGAEPIDEKIIDPSRVRKSHSGKKLFRDPDDKIISGVCSGIAAYFGISDPVWVRLIFGVMLIGGGVGLPLYIILRIIMPKADTAADRLAMKGEPIDYKSIAKTIQDEIEHLSHEFGGGDDTPDTKKHWDATGSMTGKGMRAGAGILSGLFAFLSNILNHIVPFILKAVAVIAIIMMSMMFIGLIFGWSMMWPFASHFISGPRMFSVLGMMNIFFAGLIPLVFVLFFVARMYNGTRLPKTIAAGLGGLWLLNMASGAMIGVNTARQFNNQGQVQRTLFEGDLKSDVLQIELGESRDRPNMSTFFGEAWLDDGKIIHPGVRVVIEESKDDMFHIIQNNNSNGESTRQAKVNAQNIGVVARLDGNNLLVNNFIELDKSEKIRNQESSIIVAVPLGKKIKIGDQVHVEAQRDDDSWDLNGQTWTMSKNGLIHPDIDVKNNKLGNVQTTPSPSGQVTKPKEAVQEVKERVIDIKNEEK